MVFVMVWIMMVVVMGRLFGEGSAWDWALDCLFGAVLGVCGLILTYSIMPAMPDGGTDRPIRIAFVSLSVALALFTLLLLLQYHLGHVVDGLSQTMDELMGQLVPVIIGAVLICTVFWLGSLSSTVRNAVLKYLTDNDAVLGADDYEKMEIRKALDSRETDKVEYKSTLRTNLGTKEKDEKIEKMVLKTLVAFMNSRGGTLLIGVADNGRVIGIDEDSFESRDKLNLHLTNLIAEHIGNEFLPFISFRLSDYEGKGVMRVVCRKSNSPVFLKEGKQESFIVRSGPSSVELHGMDTLNYVNNRFKKRKKGKLFKKE